VTIWEYVPLAEYTPPTPSVKAISENWFAELRRRFGAGKAQAEPFEERESLKALPAWQLQRIAPAPAWRAAAQALDVRLEHWLADRQSQHIPLLFIGPPYSGHVEILQLWAELHDWRVIEPPASEEVFAGDLSWLSDQIVDDQPWVFPHLERTYLRHTEGLGLIRRFFDQVYAGNLGCGLIGCDSWGWTFLRRFWPEHLSNTLALRAFDEKLLSHYLQALASGGEDQHLLFRQSDNGKYVFPPPEDVAVNGSVHHSDYMQRLAVHSRGILGIAWTIWHNSLRIEPDEEIAEEAQAEAVDLPGKTVWVAPWSQIKHPVMPPGAIRHQAFVLHALLLHSGLTGEQLAQVTPLTADEVTEMIYLLQNARVLAESAGFWRVTAQGYPVARQFLVDNGYPVDEF